MTLLSPGKALLWVSTGTSPLPLTIRDRRLRVMQSGLGNAEYEVDAGLYVIEATLPGNRQLAETVEVAAGRAYRVDLVPEVAEPPPRSRVTPVRRPSMVAGRGDAVLVAGGGETPTGWTIGVAAARPPFGHADRVPADIVGVEVDGQVRTIELRLARGAFFAVVAIERSRVLTIALPGTAPTPSQCLLISDERVTPPAVAAYPPGPSAQLAVQYLVFGDAENGTRLFPPGMPERLVRGTPAERLRAAVGGYLLLRLGKADRLTGWPEVLARRASWLPDAAVIAGEAAALAGNHVRATEYFAVAGENGPPMFTDGFSIMVSRLRQYSRDSPIRRALAAPRLAALDRLRELYERCAPYVDLRAPTTTLRGVDLAGYPR